MAKTRHVHKYIRRNIGTKEKPTYRYCCSFSFCTHYQPSLELTIGKKSICWQCDKEFVLTSPQIKELIKKPRCFDCRTEKPDDNRFDNLVIPGIKF